jgi:hypothetical protein
MKESASVLDTTVRVATEEHPQLECVCTLVGTFANASSHDPTSLDSPVPTVVGTGVGTELIEERPGVIHML